MSATPRALDEEACQNVEVIGWLYQFYICEKKDAVFAAKEKVAAEDIPAATQLFTPHWIVRYLVENSLGRLWMLNHPDSRLIERWTTTSQPEQPETGFPENSVAGRPEHLRPGLRIGAHAGLCLRPALCHLRGSRLHAVRHPQLILTHNLYGIEIDERAGALAAFALTMKAREKHRRFFRNPVAAQVCVLENIEFSEEELARVYGAVGQDLFTFNLRTLLHRVQGRQALRLADPPGSDRRGDLLDILREKNVGGQMFLHRRIRRC